MKKIFLILLLSVYPMALSGQTVEIDKLPTISVTGTAEIQVVPDMVTFRLRVTKSDKSLTVAKAQNDTNIAKLLDLTRKSAINPVDVKTDFISVKEKYDHIKQKGDEEFTDVFAGYTVSRTMIVRLRDLKKFEQFFTDVVQTGVTEVSDVTFESSELRKFKDQARAMAVRAAREKAESISKEVGQTIGKAVSIAEENVDGFRSPYANASSNSFSIDGSGANNDTAIGTISVKAQVKVDFLLN
jgi:uncharacterized protein YggE